MATLFKNSFALDVGTSYVTIFECTDEKVYSIISGMTIANKKLNEIQVTARIIDATNLVTAYLISDSKLSVGSSLALCGDLQKIILKNGDSIEIKANEDNAIDVMISAIDNDPSFFYDGKIHLPWYGDTAFIAGGESYTNKLSEYIFSTDAASAYIQTLTDYISQTLGASNSIIGLMIGGTRTYIFLDAIKSRTFSSREINYNWSTLNTAIKETDASSNGSQYITFGGYKSGVGAYEQMQYGTFDSDIITENFGTLYNETGLYQTGAAGNSIYAVCVQGNTRNNIIQYVEHSTKANATLWGNARNASFDCRGAANEEIMLYIYGQNFYPIDYIEFASKGNATFWANLDYANMELGAVTDSLSVLFTCGESYSYSHKMSMITQATSTRITGLGYFDGGCPVSESGEV